MAAVLDRVVQIPPDAVKLDTKYVRPPVKDVAERDGVSWATVSNVIHDPPYTRAETHERVETAISELGYQTSLAVHQLRRRRSTAERASSITWQPDNVAPGASLRSAH